MTLTTGLMLGGAGAAAAYPPNIPSEATARSELAQLTVAPDGSSDGYDRDKFPHWHTVDGNCDTRETVLKRDADYVEVGNDCYPTSGKWYSSYDGERWYDPSDVDIDHMIPLANAWRTGARDWTTAKREAFANDLSVPQLWAVTDNVNQSKGDRTPATWKPPRYANWCVYARAWIHVKYTYDLTINSDENGQLHYMLNTC